MGSLAEFIDRFPPMMWEHTFSVQQTAMLLQVSKATAQAVREIVPGYRRQSIWVAPSAVATDEDLRWNRLWWTAGVLQRTGTNIIVHCHEDDTANYQNSFTNLVGLLDFIPNVRILDMSRGPIHEPVVQWSRQESDAFALLLGQKCVFIEDLTLGAAMLPMVCWRRDDAQYWSWMNNLPLRCLTLINIGLSWYTAGDVLSVAWRKTSLTALHMDANPISDLGDILNDDVRGLPYYVGLDCLSLSSCGLGKPENFGGGEAVVQRSIDSVARLITTYTRLRTLHLNNNEYSDPHGKAIAQALRTSTSLTCLELYDNNFSPEVMQEIRGAWTAHPQCCLGLGPCSPGPGEVDAHLAEEM